MCEVCAALVFGFHHLVAVEQVAAGESRAGRDLNYVINVGVGRREARSFADCRQPLLWAQQPAGV